MKKLMIAAVAAVMAGVTFAADCDLKGCMYAYRLKLAGKTVKAKSAADVSNCDLGKCWQHKTSLRIAGYLYKVYADKEECDCTCDETSLLGTKEPDWIFWNEKKEEVVFDKVTIALAEVLRNGGTKDKVQLLIKLGTGTEEGIYLAGFGVYNPQSGNLKRANGFFAGSLPVTQCQKENEDCTITGVNPNVFLPCKLDTAEESAGSIAYGRWNLAYKSEKVALIKKVGVDGALKPAAFKAASDEGDQG